MVMSDKTNKKLSIKVKTCSRSRYPNPRNRQGGALLLGLIITMVIFGLLGGAMVYIFSSSTMDTVFGNFAQRAYYAAESGMRYAAATYWKTGDHVLGKYRFDLLDLQTLSFPNNNGEAHIDIYDNMPGVTSDVVAFAAEAKPTWVVNDSLLVGSVAGFPTTKGFFRIGIGTTYYSYKTISGTAFQGITGPGNPSTWPPVIIGETITAPQGQYLIKSVGSFGLFRRTVEYGWILSGLPGGEPPPPPPLPYRPEDMEVDTGAMRFKAVDAPAGEGVALWVQEDQGEGGKVTEAYVLPPSATPNPFRIDWLGAGNYSSYDLQVKIATNGTVNESDYSVTDWGDSFRPDTYASGLAFRAIKHPSQNQYGFLGLAIMRSHVGGVTDGITDTMVPPYIPPVGTPAWAANQNYVIGTIVERSGSYYKCILSHNPSATLNRPPNMTYWELLSNNDKPMIVLWRRDRNDANGDDRWLAYSMLNQSGNDHIVDSTWRVKDWSTLLVRVVEGASLRFTAPTDFEVNDIVTAAGGSKIGKVIKKIQTTDGLYDVLILNNVTGIFTTETISAQGRTPAANLEYRARDNYIWAMFGDQDPHPTANNDPLDGTRHANVRLTDYESITPLEVAKRIHWPEDNIQDDPPNGWGKVLNLPEPFNVKNDYFKLVQWNLQLNSDSELELDEPTLIMGFGKEQGAIIRIADSEWFRPGPYTDATFPPEIGLAALGNTSHKTFFDDFIYRLPFIDSRYGIEYVPPVQSGG